MNVSISATCHVQPATMTIPAELSQQLRRADTFIQLAVGAVHQAILQSPQIPAESPARCGLFLGTAHGPMQTGFAVLDHIIDNQQTSPTLFSHSVFNAAAGYLARIFSLQGRAVTLTDFAWPFFQALQQGYLALSSGRLDRCFVLQVETYSELFLATSRELLPPTPGCICWLLDSRETGGSRPRLTALTINSQPGSGEMYLNRWETLCCNDRVSAFFDPLATLAAMNTLMIATGLPSPCELSLTAPYGNVRLTIEQPQDNQVTEQLSHRSS